MPSGWSGSAVAAEQFGLDTNVLIYLIDAGEPVRQARAREVVERAAATGRCTLSVQSLGEFFVVAVRKGLATPATAQQAVDDLTVTFAIASPTAADARTAVSAAVAGRLGYWDALLLATLDRAGCSVVLSEDMGDGARHGGVTIRNPFAGEHLPDAVEGLLT
jgi:predicted nucleic acid-binding protein